MSDRPAAERACKDPNPIIDGRKANVNLAYLGAKPRVQTGESGNRITPLGMASAENSALFVTCFLVAADSSRR